MFFFSSFYVIMYVWAGEKKKDLFLHFLCHDTQINLSFQGVTLIPISRCFQRAPPDRGEGISGLSLKMQPQAHLHKSLISVTPSVLKRQKMQKALRVIKRDFFFFFLQRDRFEISCHVIWEQIVCGETACS